MLRWFYIAVILCFIVPVGAQSLSDTIPFDPINKELTPQKASDNIKISDSGLEEKLISGSIDSQRYDHRNNLIHLYGDAFVKYQNKELHADYIILDMENNIAEAHRQKGVKGAKKPTFKDGDKEYQYNGLKYNFDTEKGIVYDAIFSEGEFIIHGQKTKYVSGKNHEGHNHEIIYNQGATITTCNHPHPHFGFKARRMKVVNEKVAVIGPSNLRLGGVATPIWLPFGFFPLVEGKSSGFIFPQDYEFNSKTLGFGFRGFGWYFPINDYVHLKLTADYFTRGTHGLYANVAYRKKYKYNGSLRLSYNNQISEEAILDDTSESGRRVGRLSTKGFSIGLTHNQDSKAHPFVTVGGSVNIVGNNNQNRNFNDAQNVLQNTYSSKFFYRHSMPGTPFNLSVGLNHNQNTRTNTVNITLPDIALNMNTIYPFKRKNKGSNKEQWYELISFDYDFKLRSFFETTDTTMFSRETIENAKTGTSNKFELGFSTRVFKHFNISPRASYEEISVLNVTDRFIDQIAYQDTTGETLIRDTLFSDVRTGLNSFRTYSAGVNLNTQLFGTLAFKGGRSGIRHTLKPTIGYNYAPDARSIYTDTLYYSDSEQTPLTYTRFDGGPFGNPRFTDLQSQLTYRIQNIFEIKYWSKKDSVSKKFKPFDNFTINGNYNFAKDTLQWSRVSMSSSTRLFGGITQVRTNWSFDPYIEVNNRAVDRTVWSENGKLLRLEKATIRISNKFNVGKLRDMFKGISRDDDDDNNIASHSIHSDREKFQQKSPEKEDLIKLPSFGSLFDNVSIDHNLVYEIQGNDEQMDSRVSIHTLGVSGRFALTDNWSISVGNLSYDFVRKDLGYTSVSFTRKLHCWDMRFSWSPNRDTYTFFIGVSSSNLSFLKYNYGQNVFDAANGLPFP